jgi:hypothetical protein
MSASGRKQPSTDGLTLRRVACSRRQGGSPDFAKLVAPGRRSQCKGLAGSVHHVAAAANTVPSDLLRTANRPTEWGTGYAVRCTETGSMT